MTCSQNAEEPKSHAGSHELEGLRSAVNRHRREGYCTEGVSVVLPERSEARDRWIARSEAARPICTAYRYCEVQKGHGVGRGSRRHAVRFAPALYTGTICSAAFEAGPGQGHLERGVSYLCRGGATVTKKRQPPIRLPDRLLASLRRWRRRAEPPIAAEAAPARMISERFPVEFNGKPIGKIKAFRAAA